MAERPQSTTWVLKHELGNYIYFSPLTTGATGRAVKIHKDLLLPFFFAVNSKTYDGQLAIRQIEQLRTTPKLNVPPAFRKPSKSHIRQLKSVYDTFQHVLMLKNLQVYYRVEQQAGDVSPVVYISQVRSTYEDANDAPGLYARKIQFSRQAGDLKKMKSRTVDGRTVFINGQSDSVKSVMKQAELIIGSRENLAIFYSPASVCNDLGVWNSPGQTLRTGIAIKELIAVIQHNRSAKNGINWIVEGEGCALLSNALESVSGDLKNHSFKIVNPKTDTPKLLQSITKKKGHLTGEFFDYSRSPTALAAIAKHKEALIKQIGLLPEAKSYDKITRQKLISQISALAQVAMPLIKNAAIGKTKSSTFIETLKKAEKHRR